MQASQAREVFSYHTIPIQEGALCTTVQVGREAFQSFVRSVAVKVRLSGAILT